MRILLVQPGNSTTLGFRQTALVEPLGLETVAGALAGHEVRLVDLRVEGDLGRVLERFRPEVVGISCSFTLDRNLTIAEAEAAKASNARPYVVVGGHYASVNPGDFAHPAIDAIAVGEGETTLADLVGSLERGEAPRGVRGLVLNTPEGQHRTGVRRLAERLDDLPMPNRGLTRGHRREYYLFSEKPMAMVETARGCPYHCSFCSVWQFYRGRYRAKGPRRVVREVAAVEEEYVLFTDDNFLADVDRANEIGVLLLAEGVHHRYAFQARSDTIVANP
ncbi:MAG: B12-binding domain-containing radical SAM protein, partial [Chloroflexi bacterium]|nr:B12-binding domain-containing radical SAM protein [Chloroflexota bacterium]